MTGSDSSYTSGMESVESFKDESIVVDGPETCNNNFSLPSKTVGPLGRKHDTFAKYAPCGHWSTCNTYKEKTPFRPCICCDKKGELKFIFQVFKSPKITTYFKASYGPYGPWNKDGPSQFISPKEELLKKLYPIQKRNKKNGIQDWPSRPLGKLAPWPLSGSCRYSGRPYGPCRPGGAYKSRGPFGIWCRTKQDVTGEFCRPSTPVQPCWKPTNRGNRPCTPCYRPLFRPCHDNSKNCPQKLRN